MAGHLCHLLHMLDISSTWLGPRRTGHIEYQQADNTTVASRQLLDTASEGWEVLTACALLVQLADGKVVVTRPLLERHQGPRLERHRLVGVRRPGDCLGGCNAQVIAAHMGT
jgi:hypothetical protein